MSSIVTVNDLNCAADDVERDIETMESLGYPTIRNRGLPGLIRRAAMQMEILKAECFRLSQGSQNHLRSPR